MSDRIHFILNDSYISTSKPKGLTVLDYLRLHQRLTGTKEGCKEGGCGACTVLLGELKNDRIIYQSVLSCLLALGELSGKHLVTIEGLKQKQLSPIQQALVDFGATQCGFCTPGIVMSLTGYFLNHNTDIKTVLHNNLCRCTGYGAIKRASNFLLESFTHQENATIATLITQGIVPEYFRNIPQRLRQLKQSLIESENPILSPEFIIAGGTDLYVQKGELLPESRLRFLNQSSHLKGITTKRDKIHIGALTTFAELANHPTIIKLIPHIQAYIQRIASYSIRHRATVGGNIITASPIGDITILLLALNAELILQEGDNVRQIPLRDFFHSYKQIDKTANEILTEIFITIPSSQTKFNWEKVSKRQYLDCAAVNSACAISCEGNTIIDSSISMGGVAPIPLYLKQTSSYLISKPITVDTIEDAVKILQTEISPVSDIHGSAQYKRLLARQLLIAHLTTLFPELINLQDFYEKN